MAADADSSPVLNNILICDTYLGPSFAHDQTTAAAAAAALKERKKENTTLL